MRKTTRKMWAATAGVAGIALLATACSSGDDAADPAESDDAGTGTEQITLKVATFNEFGFESVYAEYEAANPGIKIEQVRAATSNEARANLTTRLAAGSGLSDIEGIEIDWMPELSEYSDKFVDLEDDALKGRWLDWKEAQGRDLSGKLIAYGTDTGPQGIAYRSDLFAAANLPTDRAEVAELFGGADATWDDYFAVGKQFADAGTGVAFFDAAGSVFQGMVNQEEAAFEDPETGAITALENPRVKEIYTTVMTQSETLSTHLGQWSPDWEVAFQNNGFATMLAPAWMLSIIEGHAKGVTGWDLADVFPGGGGNWGGSFLTVPEQGAHPEEAKALAAWLTSPETQAKIFLAAGNFPSTNDALTDEGVLAATNPFFNEAPIGEIFTSRANAISEMPIPYKGSKYFAVSDAMSQAISRVDIDKTDDIDSSWVKFEEAVKALG